MSVTDSAIRTRIDELVRRWRLPAGAGRGLLSLVDLIAGPGRAPISVRDPLQAVDDHLADALVALELGCVQSAQRIVDLGAGAGFPGLPLALALPEAAVSLVESNQRKCAFMSRAAEIIGAGNVTIVNQRVEEWAAGRGQHDLVTARAVAPLPVVAEYAAPMLSLGGALVAWRGRREPHAEQHAAAAAAALGLSPAEPLHVVPYRGAQHRHLHVMVKQRETPPRFPRRAGMAAKRPLGLVPGPAPAQGTSDRPQR